MNICIRMTHLELKVKVQAELATTFLLLRRCTRREMAMQEQRSSVSLVRDAGRIVLKVEDGSKWGGTTCSAGSL